MSIKQKIKNIPLLGSTLFWINNFLKLNKIKDDTIEDRKTIKELSNLLKNQESITYDLVRTHIVKQSIAFHQKIDSFCDSFNKSENSHQNQITKLKDTNNSELISNFYFEFENKFRGKREDILKRYEAYLKYVPQNIEKSLDLACGRAEWVQLLQAQNIDAYGIDQNLNMLNLGINAGVKNLLQSDIFEYLDSAAENSFDLISSFHLIEHISYTDLVSMLLKIKNIAKNEAIVLLETPNPNNMIVASNNFYLDPTHRNPIPSAYLKFLLEYLGFKEVEVFEINPMHKINLKDKELEKLLNKHFYGPQDYLIRAKVEK